MSTPLSLRQADALSRSPQGHSALTGTPYLLLDARGRGSPRVARWLRSLPCPVIARAARGNDRTVERACDAVVDDPQDLITGITKNPITAATLVQLLRVTEKLPIEDALIAESLAYAALQSGAEHKRWLATNKPAPAPRDEGPAVVLTREGARLSLELNRPSSRNAMSVEMRDALNEAFELVLADRSIKSVTLEGRGKCFSTGGALAEFGTVPDPMIGHAVRSVALPGRLLARCASRVTAQVHSACIGSGIELPAFAGKLIAAKHSFFQLPELSMGLIPGAGGTVSVSRRIGRQRTAQWILGGETIDAATARAWRLVDAFG